MAIHHAVAGLLAYPDNQFAARLEEAETALSSRPDLPLAAFGRFREAVAGMSLGQLQELYCSTFDLGTTCALEVGWQLFGEDYKRGAFLVSMRQELAMHDLAEGGELADHLSHILPLLAAQEPTRADGLVKVAVLPAVSKMRQALDGKNNPYFDVLVVVEETLQVLHAPTVEVS